MIMSDNPAARFSKWTAAAAVLLGVLSLPAFALEPEGQTNSEAAASEPIALEASDVRKDGQDETTTEQRKSSQTNNRVIDRRKTRIEKSNNGDAGSEGSTASLTEVLSHIEEKYYGGIDRRELERAAIEAIMAKLDERSNLLSRDEFEQLQVSVDGDLVGVGIAIHVDSDSGKLFVTRPIRNSPGEAAGIRSNDEIVTINGEAVEGVSLRDVVGRIRGPRGSEVTLGIQRADERLEVTITRERFETSVVNPLGTAANGQHGYWVDRANGIGYVHIPAFTRHTESQLQKVLAGLSKQGLKGLVLDLRDCGGGLMSAAIGVVDMFIDEGTIVSSEGRDETERSTFRAKPGGDYLDLPVAVLMNGNTASAAEIVAAALQDHHRAAAIGEQTYGRGTVQAIFRLNDGSALKLTTSAWLRPNGRTLMRREGRDDWGVQPDEGHAVVVTEEDHKQLAKQRVARLNGEEVDSPVEDKPLTKAVSVLRSI